MSKNKIFLLILSITLSTYGFSQKKVAVFNPTGIDDEVVIEVARETLIHSIISSANYTLLEREQIEQVMKENQYQASGMVDDSQISEIGKQAGAEYVCVGTVHLLGNKYFFSARLVDVETAQATVSGKYSDSDVFTALEKAAEELVKASGGATGKNMVISLTEIPDNSPTEEELKKAKQKQKELEEAIAKQKAMEKELAEIKKQQDKLEKERKAFEEKQKELAEARAKAKAEADERARKDAEEAAKAKAEAEELAKKEAAKEAKEQEKKELAEAKAKAKEEERIRKEAEAKAKATAEAEAKRLAEEEERLKKEEEERAEARAKELAAAKARAEQMERKLAEAKKKKEAMEKEAAATKKSSTGASRLFANRDASKRTISLVTAGRAFEEEIADVVSEAKKELAENYNIASDYKLPFQVKPTVKKWSGYAKVDYVINYGIGTGNKIVVNIYNANKKEFRFFYSKIKADTPNINPDDLINLYKEYLDK